MLEREFQPLDALADEVDGSAERWLAEDPALREALKEATAGLPQSYSVELVVELRVFDVKRERAIRILSVGLNAQPKREPYETSGDSSPHRYLVDGEICHIPHEYCPHCWGAWDFKLQQPVCPSCGYTLGREVKLLLDSNRCPHCDEGTVSLREPTCNRCGFEVDPTFVSWG